ncbi:ATP-binding protein [Aspergillus melleus]|uniref:ATP-binding protein n=1 Tax=Aspergillus melleus TaxID=138277 RepID=UPI001E8EDABC|nr:uncharacterized protein LDX57_007149 [Aspergillus melleus]KAH8429487.1 hypothetical protein LDX57_007149 [Aspergillus melleus]
MNETMPSSSSPELVSPDLGLDLQVKHLEQRKKEGDSLKERGSEVEGEKPTYMQHALVSSEYFDEKNILTKKVLCINSSLLCDALKQEVKCYPSYRSGFKPSIEVESPFALLFHHRSELGALREYTTDDNLRKHLDLLFEYLEHERGHAAARLMNNDLITFDLLWAVFKPGTFVLTRVYDQEWLLWLQNTAYRKHYQKGEYLALECSHSIHDGEKEWKVVKTLEIFRDKEFPGSAPTTIRKLSVSPLERHSNSETLKSTLKSRGETYQRLQHGRPHYYEGMCLVVDNTKIWDPKTYPCTTAGRVVIDNKPFFEEHEAMRPTLQTWDYDDEGIDEADTDLLYPPYVYGYSLDMRKWSRFFLNNLSDVKWDNNMFNRLLLAEPQKQLLRSLVSNHSYGSNARHEIILKGKGLVVVLHGSPGTGKTLTAAAVAEETNKPLIVFPAGELGYELWAVEDNVKKIVEYATSWKAVLLIDEADVFLEKRESGARANLERNALVAVFLRRLEYCQGIIFLTSNRAESFDGAIKSRVHLMLHYPEIDQTARRQLWKSRLEEVPPDENEVDMARFPDSLAKYPMNGREISNTVGSALTLAKSESQKLNQRHLDMVLRIWQESNPKWTQGYNMLRMVIHVVLSILATAVIIVLVLSRRYQMFRNGDVLIFYR